MLNHPRFACASVQLESGGYVVCGSDQRLSFSGTQPYTIEAWIYQHDVAGSQSVFSRVHGGHAAEYSLSVQDGYVKSYRNVTPWEVGSRKRLPPKQWNHIATSYDGQVLRLYVNGLEDASAPFSSIPDAKQVEVAIGAVWKNDLKPTAHFNGMIAEVRVWKVARSRDQIVSDFAQHAEPAPGMVALYDFTSLPFVERAGGSLPFALRDGARPCLCVPGVALGGAGYVELGGTADLAFDGIRPYTIEGWFSPLANPLTGVLVSKFDQGRGAEYRVGADTGQRLDSYRNVHPWKVASAPLSSNDYYHFATSFDGAVLRLYVNGNLHSAQAFSSQPPARVATLLGAAFAQGKVDSHFRGQIQNVRFWNRALTEAQIRQWIHSDPVTHPDLLANCDFTVSPPQDLTGRHTLTFNGDAHAGYVMVPVDPASPQARLGFMLPVAEHHPAPAPIPRVGRGAGVSPLSAELESAILSELQARLAAMAPEDAVRMREAAADAIARARRALEEDPLLGSVSQRVENGQVVLTYHAADGDYEIYRGAEHELDACTLWWLGLIYHLTVGLLLALAGPLGLPSGGTIAMRLYQMVRNNPRAWDALRLLLISPTITPQRALLVVRTFCEQGLIWPILRMAFTWASWFLLRNAVVLVLAVVTDMEGAVLLAGVAIWVTKLILKLKDNPCPKLMLETAGAG